MILIMRHFLGKIKCSVIFPEVAIEFKVFFREVISFDGNILEAF